MINYFNVIVSYSVKLLWSVCYKNFLGVSFRISIVFVFVFCFPKIPKVNALWNLLRNIESRCFLGVPSKCHSV